MHRISVTFVVVICLLAQPLSAVERSVEEFKEYAAKRLFKVDQDDLNAYVAKVDSDSDGKISEEEFRGRVKAYLQVFKQVTVKTQKLGHGLPDNWLTDWHEAKKKSSETGKPILAMFSASWCGPCKTMIGTVFPTDEAMAALEDFVPVYIDSEKQRELASENGIRAFPTFKCFASNAEEAAEHVGAKPTEGFIELLKDFKGAAFKLKEAEAAETDETKSDETEAKDTGTDE